MRWDAEFTTYIGGYKQGSNILRANFDKWFPIKDDSIVVSVDANISEQVPEYLYQKYYSNRIQWENNFANTGRRDFRAEISYPAWKLKLGMSAIQLDNYIFFGNQARPVQASESINITTAYLHNTLGFSIFRWKNRIAWQKASANQWLNLPELSLYSSFYIDYQWKTIMRLQFGAEVYYDTEFYLPSYMPATGQFYLQHDNLGGDYALTSIFLNMQIQRLTFFFKYYHANTLLYAEQKHFMANYHPLSDADLRVGVMWRFHD